MIQDPSTTDWARVAGPVLLAGDAQGLPEMLAIARLLPPDARVTVLVEAFSRLQVYRVRVPDGVQLHWLVREREEFDTSPCAVRTRGSRLGPAVHAWCLEWGCSITADPPQCTVWLGPRVPRAIARMVGSLLDRASSVDRRSERAS